MNRFKSSAALVAAAALAACAVLSSPERQAQRAAPFDLSGRVAVADAGRVFSSGIRWQHDAESDEIWLLTPTGQALAHIQAEASGATLTGADGNQYHAGDVESLTRKALGWELPMARLAWWVRGEIVPGAVTGEVVRDQQGRLIRLTQDGWRITYVQHDSNETGGLPQRLDLIREANRIRLVIDGWR